MVYFPELTSSYFSNKGGKSGKEGFSRKFWTFFPHGFSLSSIHSHHPILHSLHSILLLPSSFYLLLQLLMPCYSVLIHQTQSFHISTNKGGRKKKGKHSPRAAWETYVLGKYMSMARIPTLAGLAEPSTGACEVEVDTGPSAGGAIFSAQGAQKQKQKEK